MKIINAEGTVAGRLSAEVAKLLMKGESIILVNAEKAVVSGNPVFVEKKVKEGYERGDPYHGPFYPKQPDRILKRMVRGMLPYKKPLGREAFKRLKVYISVPEELKGKDIENVKSAENKLRCKSTSIGELSVKLGGKKTWQ